ncbi:hypothetical protein ACFLU6_13520 [Acidobacteriota bacterium]
MKKTALLIAVILTMASFAHGNSVIKKFYKKKRQTTTREAFIRCENRLAKARIGMSQTDFFDLMRMEVLAKDGEVQDVMVDGYLWDASQKIKKQPNTRNLVFGYREKGREIIQFLVVFKNNKVHKIERLNRYDPAKKK